ncbi:hypothetical protein XENORESO_011652 [Xenotaenia resolanae]|uniref:Uncharacterized protein n=1 Tax=Xenotaenia resolanae TaxID=208358 RepID=A0ABV0X261_9TELE
MNHSWKQGIAQQIIKKETKIKVNFFSYCSVQLCVVSSSVRCIYSNKENAKVMLGKAGSESAPFPSCFAHNSFHTLVYTRARVYVYICQQYVRTYVFSSVLEALSP